MRTTMTGPLAAAAATVLIPTAALANGVAPGEGFELSHQLGTTSGTTTFGSPLDGAPDTSTLDGTFATQGTSSDGSINYLIDSFIFNQGLNTFRFEMYFRSASTTNGLITNFWDSDDAGDTLGIAFGTTEFGGSGDGVAVAGLSSIVSVNIDAFLLDGSIVSLGSVGLASSIGADSFDAGDGELNGFWTITSLPGSGDITQAAISGYRAQIVYTVVPAPGCAALLGLAGFAARRRRA